MPVILKSIVPVSRVAAIQNGAFIKLITVCKKVDLEQKNIGELLKFTSARILYQMVYTLECSSPSDIQLMILCTSVRSCRTGRQYCRNREKI